MEQGLISFFDVKECGFYRIRRTDSEYVSGSLSESIKLVYDWLQGRDFDQTIPWNPEVHAFRTQIYCKSVYSDSVTGDFVFVLWKKFGENSGNINGVLAKSKVDDKGKDTHKFETSVKGQDVILGEPMYYWFIPEHNLIASIKFPNSLSDSDAVFNYIKKCIDLRIPNPNKKESERSVYNQHLGRDIITKSTTYRSIDDKYSLTYRLKAELKELSINESSLDSLSKKITHIVIRESIKSEKSVQKDSLFSMFDKMVGKNEETISREKQVEIVSEESVSKEMLQSMIVTYNDEFDSKSTWNNVGFKIDGIESPTKWFDRYVDRKHILMDESKKKDGSYYTADKLFIDLKRERVSLLDFMANPLQDKLTQVLIAHDEESELMVNEA